MKRTKRILALACVLAIFFSCFSVVGLAASEVSSINVQKNSAAAKTKGDFMVFYFKATGTQAKISFSRTKGKLQVTSRSIKDSYTVYGAYELRLQQCDNKGNLIGKELSKQSVYNNSNQKTTVTFQTTRNAYYRVRVWSWNPNTLSKSYLNNNQLPGLNYLALSMNGALKANRVKGGVSAWTTLPGCTAKSAGNCVMYNSFS